MKFADGDRTSHSVDPAYNRTLNLTLNVTVQSNFNPDSKEEERNAIALALGQTGQSTGCEELGQASGSAVKWIPGGRVG